MLYRRSAQLALQATILLALEPQGNPKRVRELAAALDVPATYLTKILQSLTRAGLLRAVRGPGGGVELARPARELYLWDVLSAVEPVGDFERCFLGLGQCHDGNPCAFHENWAPLRARVLELLKRQNLWDFATEAHRKGLIANVGGPVLGVMRFQKRAQL